MCLDTPSAVGDAGPAWPYLWQPSRFLSGLYLDVAPTESVGLSGSALLGEERPADACHGSIPSPSSLFSLLCQLLLLLLLFLVLPSDIIKDMLLFFLQDSLWRVNPSRSARGKQTERPSNFRRARRRPLFSLVPGNSFKFDSIFSPRCDCRLVGKLNNWVFIYFLGRRERCYISTRYCVLRTWSSSFHIFKDSKLDYMVGCCRQYVPGDRIVCENQRDSYFYDMHSNDYESKQPDSGFSLSISFPKRERTHVSGSKQTTTQHLTLQPRRTQKKNTPYVEEDSPKVDPCSFSRFFFFFFLYILFRFCVIHVHGAA